MSEPETYVMPKPFLHEIVHFYEEGSTTPSIAWVRSIGPGVIDVVTFTNRIETVGVRHKSDPGLTKNDDRFVYSWDFTEAGKLLRELAATVAPLQEPLVAPPPEPAKDEPQKNDAKKSK